MARAHHANISGRHFGATDRKHFRKSTLVACGRKTGTVEAVARETRKISAVTQGRQNSSSGLALSSLFA